MTNKTQTKQNVLNEATNHEYPTFSTSGPKTHLGQIGRAFEDIGNRIDNVNEALADKADASAIPGNATASKAGLMSAKDKAKLDGLQNYVLPEATTDVLGGVKVGAGLTVAGDGTISTSAGAGALSVVESTNSNWGIPGGFEWDLKTEYEKHSPITLYTYGERVYAETTTDLLFDDTDSQNENFSFVGAFCEFNYSNIDLQGAQPPLVGAAMFHGGDNTFLTGSVAIEFETANKLATILLFSPLLKRNVQYYISFSISALIRDVPKLSSN